MPWRAELSNEAAKQLLRLPRPIGEHMARAIDELEADPFCGDVKPLKGRRWQGGTGSALAGTALFLPCITMNAWWGF